MERLIYKLKGFAKWWITIIASIVFLVSVVVYVRATENLVKPATTAEAIKFLFSYTKEYCFALIMGFIAKFIPFVFLPVTLGSLFEYMDSDYSSKNYFIIMCVVNVLLFVITMIIQSILVKFWGSIVIVAVILTSLVYAVANDM